MIKVSPSFDNCQLAASERNSLVLRFRFGECEFFAGGAKEV
jgi:hypothetical protein